MNIEDQRLAVRRADFDAHYGMGAADKVMSAPHDGKTLLSVAEELGITKQYLSYIYVRLTGRTWSSVLSEKGINTRGPRSRKPSSETV